MLTSITPLGERGRGRRWTSTASWYVAGSTLGGAAVGALAGLLAEGFDRLGPSKTVATVGAAAICALAATWDLTGRRPRSWRRQVDETWLGRYRGWVIGGGFGLQLGFGVLTIVTSASVYAMLALAVLTGSFWAAFAIGASFGLARALPLLAARRVRTNDALAGLHRRVAALAPRAHWVTVGVLGLSSAALIAVAFT